MASDWAKVWQAAEAQGWRTEVKKKGWMLFPPDKSKAPVMVHRTPSDHRALKNTIAEMRRQGFVWPWKETEGPVKEEQ